MSKNAFIIPLRREKNIWSFLHPLSYEVWILTIISIPFYTLVWGLLNCLTSRQPNWTTLVGFVLRNSMIDPAKMPDKATHEKALTFGWIWFTLFLVCGYTANLLALITSPELLMPIRETEDFLDQSELSIVMEDTVEIDEYISKLPHESVIKRVYDKIELWDSAEWYSGCFTKSTQYSGKHASLCDIHSINVILHQSFSNNGQCDWYLAESTFFESPLVVVLQVYYLKKSCM